MRTIIKYTLSKEQYDAIFGNDYKNAFFANILEITPENFAFKKKVGRFTNEDLRKICKFRGIEYPILTSNEKLDYFDDDDIVELEMAMEEKGTSLKKLSEVCGVSGAYLTRVFQKKQGIRSDITDKLFDYLYPDD